MHSVDDLMKLADEAIHAYAAWLAEFTTGELPSHHVDRLNAEKDAARRKLEAAIRATCGVAASLPTEQQAYDMGAKGAPATDRERLLFEAWMRGHCWALCATWNGKQYVSDAEQGGDVDPRAMATRRLWAAWRDRAAIGVQGMAGARIAVMAGGVWLGRDTPDGGRYFGFDAPGIEPADLPEYAKRISDATGIPLADGVEGKANG